MGMAINLFLGGLDTTKEDYMVVNNLCAERGLATLAFDGPGQGEVLYEMLWRQDFGRAICAVLKPTTARKVRASRDSAASAGWQQPNRSRSRSS